MKTYLAILLLLLSPGFINAQSKRKPTAKVGDEAPDLVFQKCLDKALAPNFYKDKIIIVDFWATWCAPCIASFPHYNELSKKFKSDKVLFATLTDEPEETALTFFKRTQKKVDGLRLIDTGKATGNGFGIMFIPFCVVIDQNNTIRWTGNTADLTEAQLQDIINNPKAGVASQPAAKTFPAVAAAPAIKPQPRTIFNFKATKAETGAVGGSSRNSKDDILEISRSSTTIGDLLGELTGYSPVSRFTTNDTAKLNQYITINYTTPFGKTDTAFAPEFAGKFVPGAPRTNYLIDLLQHTFYFQFKLANKQANAYEMVIIDQKKLDNFKSLQTGHSSFSADVKPKFEIVGYTLKSIAERLEGSFNKIIVFNVNNNAARYDLSLDISNIQNLNKTLAFHGLQLKEVNTNVKMGEVKFN